ncbi:MAG: lipopolysaccharide heptosyltransferase I [Legionellaceae bacterium]|nr:lipopolysaccharide heptosyltransferase I [Legionellaceae bacterium]MBP9775097.1 lipopolysaccharide heptosyltransferase I [Legionellaceae bacterium]
MKKILLIKMTSMGDLIQLLPALTDATNAIPGIRFDWVTEDSFKDIPNLHPSIDKIIPLPSRRWKKNLLSTLQSGEIQAFIQQLRGQNYDMVIDAQSNLKSAVVSLFAKGQRFGLDKRSVREYGAQFAYHKTFAVNRQQNHAQRLRQLFALCLGYPVPQTPANYGIEKKLLPELDFYIPEKFVFITPIASVANKLWPEPFWQEIIHKVVQLGYEVFLPWWSPEEKERVLRLQNQHPKVHLLPTLNLRQKASVIARAAAAISLDTGLAHLAAALDIPNVCLYGPGDFKLCGTVGYKQIHVSANSPDCAPCRSQRCTYQGATKYQPACMASISPQQVLAAFHALVS